MRFVAEHPHRNRGLAHSAWEQYGQELQRYLVHRLQNAQDARDLAQEIYLRLLRTGTDEQIRDFRAYLYRIASNVVYEFKFRNRCDARLTFDSDAVREWDERPPHFLPDPLSDQISTEKRLERLFDQLPTSHQAVFLL